MASEPPVVPSTHDLLWGLTVQQLPADAPAWVCTALARNAPVVVRRAVAAPGWVAVGVRGAAREQRFATWMPLTQVRRCVPPEAIVRAERWTCHKHLQWPALRALLYLAPQLNGMPLSWGITGSLGFELASGLAAAHPASDLDLLIRAPQPLSRALAITLCHLFDHAPCRVDVQMETPQGAVALREWAKGPAQVMLKSNSGPLLICDPWAAQRTAA
jgi:phosphoribosyl-dephospho-CoA transferase